MHDSNITSRDQLFFMLAKLIKGSDSVLTVSGDPQSVIAYQVSALLKEVCSVIHLVLFLV